MPFKYGMPRAPDALRVEVHQISPHGKDHP